MSALEVFASIVLGFLVITAVLGVISLRAWLRHRSSGFPVAKVVTHVTLQTVSIALWVGFIFTLQPWLAWVTFAVITAGQVFGDLLMLASHRLRHRNEGGLRYRDAAKDVLGFSRPVVALHAIIGALGWFTMIAVCIVATLG